MLRRLPVVLAAVALAALSLAAAHLTAGVSGAPRAVAAAKPGPGACGQPCAKRARKQCRSKRGKAKRRCLRRVKRRCAQRHCQAQPKPYRIDGIAYATLLNHFGGWIGPRLASGEPDFSVIDDILRARPTHLRLSHPPNRCIGGQCSTLQPRDPAVLKQLLRLRRAGIKIGAALNIAREVRDGVRRQRPVAEVVRHACEIKRADTHGLYQWLFLDFVHEAPQAQRIARRISRGTDCPAGGWRTIANATNYRGGSGLPSASVAHAKRFSLLVGPADTLAPRLTAAAEGRRAVVPKADRTFIAEVRRSHPRAVPLLKLEIPHQSKRFGELDRALQIELLRRWARAQHILGFRMIYPLFIYPGPAHPPYNSRAHRTYKAQTKLLAADLARARKRR